MTLRIGTLSELKGEGYEILVDASTRSMILARFYDGRLIRPTCSSNNSLSDGNGLDEDTIILEDEAVENAPVCA